jgi:hypothetical protein
LVLESNDRHEIKRLLIGAVLAHGACHVNPTGDFAGPVAGRIPVPRQARVLNKET